MEYPASNSNPFEVEGRLLTPDMKVYLTTNPSDAFGRGTGKVGGLEQFVTNRLTDIEEGRVAGIDPLEMSAAAWAALEIGYATARQQGFSSEPGKRKIDKGVARAGKLFGALTASAWQETSLYSDEHTYSAMLGITALQFAHPAPDEATLAEATAAQYARAVECLTLAQTYQAQLLDERDRPHLINPLNNIRARLIGMISLMRNNSPEDDESRFLALLPPVRFQKTLLPPALVRRHWNLSAWHLPSDKLRRFSLATPPDITWQLLSVPNSPRRNGPGIQTVSLRETLLASTEREDLDLFATTAQQELNNPQDCDPRGLELLDEASRKAKTLAMDQL